VLFTALPYSNKVHHYGSRLAFKEGHLYITVGDRGERHRAQDLTDNAGKVHRINPDGSIPGDNPFLNKKTSSGATIPASIYSYGHRNPQGMYVDKLGQLWIHEHGPRGGDELNLVLKGHNYGWPIITYGREYWGPSIGEGTQKKGMQQPKHYYVPSIAPSGLIRYESNLFKEWKGDFLIGSLKKRHLNRLSLNLDESGSDEPVKEHRYLHHLDTRIRDIDVDTQGAIYLLTDEYNGKLIKVTPK
jgi:glucose/arabinose dehydrogenase